MFTKIYKLIREFISTKPNLTDLVIPLAGKLFRWLNDFFYQPVKEKIYSISRQLFRELAQNRITRFLFFSGIFVPPIVVLLFTVILPLRNLSEKQVFDSTASQLEILSASVTEIRISTEQDSLLNRAQFLEIEEAFLNSRIQMAKNDSLTLSLDLIDSVASIDMQGVPLRKCKISSFQLSRVFDFLPGSTRCTWLSAPFTVLRDRATTPKVPIVVKKAPRDTVEALQMASEPVAPKLDDVFFCLEFDRNLILEVFQTEPLTRDGRLIKAKYDLQKIMKRARKNAGLFLHPSNPAYEYKISITLSQNDARAIYRAIPFHAQMALRF